jgi:hypothetical protein
MKQDENIRCGQIVLTKYPARQEHAIEHRLILAQEAGIGLELADDGTLRELWETARVLRKVDTLKITFAA